MPLEHVYILVIRITSEEVDSWGSHRNVQDFSEALSRLIQPGFSPSVAQENLGAIYSCLLSRKRILQNVFVVRTDNRVR